MPQEVRSKFMRSIEDQELASNTVFFMHQNNNGHLVPLNLAEESHGTQKLFALAGPWIDVLTSGRVLVVDELNNSLHPLMVRYLLDLVHDPERNRAGAQVLFTTHDTSVFDRNLIRRDQVWFVEKDEHNALGYSQVHLWVSE